MTTRTASIQLNGVDVTALEETMEAIEKQPELARFEFRATNRWQDGGHNRSTIKEFYGAGQEDESREQPFVFDADEPPVLLGRNLGANPVEYILHAAVACLTTTFVYYAAAQGVKVEAIETSVEGDLDIRGLLGLGKDATVEYERIRMTMKVTADAPEEKIRELARLAEMRSPSFNSVARPVPIDVRPIKA